MRTDLTFGSDLMGDDSHVDTVRTPLTRNIGAKFLDVRDEIIAAFTGHIPAQSNGITFRMHFAGVVD